MIRKSVRKLMQQIGQVEREKDEYKMQLQATKKELEDATNQQIRYEHKMTKLQHTLRAVNEEKANLDTKLNQKQMTLQSVEEALKMKTDDLNALADKYKSLDSQFSALQEQKTQIEVGHNPRNFSFCFNFYCVFPFFSVCCSSINKKTLCGVFLGFLFLNRIVWKNPRKMS